MDTVYTGYDYECELRHRPDSKVNVKQGRVQTCKCLENTTHKCRQTTNLHRPQPHQIYIYTWHYMHNTCVLTCCAHITSYSSSGSLHRLAKLRSTDEKCILTFQSLAVSLRTAGFNIQKFYMVLALLWVFCTDHTATFVLYVIRWMVFIAAVDSVYSAVRTDSLYKADYF
jgi:hypothetical protein